MNTPILEVSDIQKYYGNKGNITKAVNKISLSVDKGEFVGIMGASGSGKTTLLNCISTIDTVTSGKTFNEIHRGAKSRKEFFDEILEVVSVLGGETSDRG